MCRELRYNIDFHSNSFFGFHFHRPTNWRRNQSRSLQCAPWTYHFRSWMSDSRSSTREVCVLTFDVRYRNSVCCTSTRKKAFPATAISIDLMCIDACWCWCDVHDVIGKPDLCRYVCDVTRCRRSSGSRLAPPQDVNENTNSCTAFQWRQLSANCFSFIIHEKDDDTSTNRQTWNGG